MYKKIMVPLDGSELAECVIPHVEAIGGGCGVDTIIFVRVVEPVHLPVGTGGDGLVFTEIDAERVRKETDASNELAAKDYLDRVVSRIKPQGVKVRSEVIVGKAAESLADYTTQNDVDLVVIATHGRSGVSRWVWGRVTDRILHSACVPVFMVRAPGCIPGI